MYEGIWHFSFTVSDIKRSIQFYTEVLGLELIHEQIGHNEYTSKLVGYPDAHIKVAMFGFPRHDHGPSGHIIELVEYVSPKGVEIDIQPCNTGSAHIAFRVNDIDAAYKRMKQLGVRFKAEEPVAITAGKNKGGYSIYFLDPDGITLEMLQPPQRG